MFGVLKRCFGWTDFSGMAISTKFEGYIVLNSEEGAKGWIDT